MPRILLGSFVEEEKKKTDYIIKTRITNQKCRALNALSNLLGKVIKNIPKIQSEKFNSTRQSSACLENILNRKRQEMVLTALACRRPR